MRQECKFCSRYYNDEYCWKNDSCEFEHITEAELETNPSELKQDVEGKQAEEVIDLKKKIRAQKEGEKREEEEKGNKAFLEEKSMGKRLEKVENTIEKVEKAMELILRKMGITAKGSD